MQSDVGAHDTAEAALDWLAWPHEMPFHVEEPNDAPSASSSPTAKHLTTD